MKKSQTLRKSVLLIFAIAFSFTRIKAQEFTAAQAKEDLRFLQTTVNQDFAFLFKKIDKTTWNSAVEDFYSQIPSLQPHEITVGFSRIISLFEYGHTQIRFSTVAQEAVLPINLYHFEDGVFIEGVQKENQQLLGAKLLKIGDMTIEDALRAIRPVVPAENDQYFKAYGLRFLTVPSVLHAQGVIPENSQTVSVSLEKDGKVFTHSFNAVPLEDMSRDYGFTIPNETWLSARSKDKTPLYLKELNEKLFLFEHIKDTKTLYVRQSSVFNDENETLKDFYTRLFEYIDVHNIEKLIYDVRLNGGGNNYNNKPLIKGIMARPKINKRGSFFYIIGRNTFSACQNLTNEIENYTEAIILGEPTAENKNFYGDTKGITLPNTKISAYLSFAWWQDMAPWDNKDWTVPHIAVEMTFSDYVNNEDPVLNKALHYTETGAILDPTKHITQLFSEGNMEQIEVDVLKMVKDPAYKYSDFEKELGEAGYRLFSQGITDAGLFFMQLVTKTYPESPSAWYSLGSALEQTKQLEKAKESYKKVISLDASESLLYAAKQRLAKL